MSRLEEHPTVVRVRRNEPPPVPIPLDREWLRTLCLEAGADDVGFVSIDRPELAGEKPHILEAFPKARTLISLVTRLHREAVRSPARSIGNLEFHRNAHAINEVAHRVAAALENKGRPGPTSGSRLPDGDGPFPGPDLGRLA